MATRRKKLDAAVEALQAYLDMRLDCQGGYPAEIDSETIPGYVVVADVDHDEAPELMIYTHEQLLEWYDRAKKYCRSDPDTDITGAMCETAPASPGR